MSALLSSPLLLLLVVGGTAAADPSAERHAEFLRLCDGQAKIVERQAQGGTGGRQFYIDAYAVRALCVAYDVTGKPAYLDVCRRWSDRMIDDQRRMIPRNGYYMNYGRAPGEDKGNWYVADCSAIAMGVLATAIRCDDPAEKARYLDSVKAFAQLVIDNWVRPSGGVANGHWPKSDKEWWCSTGVFGSLAFGLHNETGERAYRDVGLGAIDWLNRQDWLTVAVHYPRETIKPTVMMYCLEAYSPGMTHVEPGSQRHREATSRWDIALGWMRENFGGRGGREYADQWGSKMGGLPFHLYVYAQGKPDRDALVALADRELDYATGVLKKSSGKSQRHQLAAFLLMSYAERVAPGKIYRTSR